MDAVAKFFTVTVADTAFVLSACLSALSSCLDGMMMYRATSCRC